MEKEEYALNNIINEIKSTANKKGYWALSSQRLIELTKIVPYKFRTYLTKTKKMVNMPSGKDMFTNNNPEDLICLLEVIYGHCIEDKFSKAGIFIPHKTRIVLNELLLNNINKAVNNHNINTEDFEAMLYGTDLFKEAKNIYYDEEFNIDGFIKETCDQFLAKNNYQIVILAKNNILLYLKSLFDRNILSKQIIFYSLEGRLKEFAKSKNLYKQENVYEKETHQNRQFKTHSYSHNNKKKHRHKQSPYIDKSDKERAKQIMGLCGDPDAKTIKKKYKELMKIYHPDVNPRGLEMSQKINCAYSILITQHI